MITVVNNSWDELLQKEFQKEYFKTLCSHVEEAYENKQIYPEKQNIFHALASTPVEKTKVVILGQDPYHGPNQAHGLSFSVKRGVKVPPSLRNIYKELQSDLGYAIPHHGFLQKWADEGVLLLNTVLTVEAHKPNSHKGIGWELFTDEVIRTLNNKNEPIIYMLWGKHAQAKEALISNPNHYILKSPHPSPFSASKGFFGSRPFSKANAILKQHGKEEVDWKIETLEE
ncbi:uracil-DNA glycosylase [Evansella cellulosilytica]|uniref:Uracil-DNA glycosylase n=1 Tax=Evansella cellulosilytica (strain ATCC 21833 / DSM 2522 / FERM P-1141 / JCM 9156 / N-4) TaxID=649639 RepID=E6TY55_EVAC2|nr:uracil-DNA glycosylase [Evansella cellulosilytica]ADU32374.1 uracil-DNA glycosylase [Evansella cellulosilytica DSM 2522]